MVVALLPGGFKPPHAGHYEAAKYLAKIAEVDKVLIKIGPSNRGGGLKYEPLNIDIGGGITPEIAKEFWEQYIKYDTDSNKNKIEIELSTLDTPVRDVYDYIENPPNEVTKVVLGLGEKESGARYQGVPKAAEQSGIDYEIVKIPPQSGGASGSATRDFIIAKSKEDFINNIPQFLPPEVKDGMWNLLSQRVKLSSEEEKELKKQISKDKAKARRAAKKELGENAPLPGESSAKGKEFKPEAKPEIKELTVLELLQTVKDIPYYKEVVDDLEKGDESWEVTKKVKEYAEYMKENPDSLKKLPPINVIDGKLDDGAHRISAIYLLQNLLDPDEPFWKNIKLKTAFYTMSDIKEMMAGTMNREEMAKHNANMKKLRKFFSKQGDQMTQIPTKLTKGLRRKLYEGRYDQETLLQGRFLFNKFKINFGKYHEENTGGVIGFDEETQEPIEYSLDFKFIPKENLQILPFVIDGEADGDIMKIKIKYNPDSFPKAYNDLNAEIRDTVRHELEHVAQHHFAKQVNPQGTKKKPTQTWYEYFTSDVEIPAFSQGLYKNAKFKKISFSKAVENFLLNYLDVLTDEEEASVIQTWTDYAKENIRTAQIDEKRRDPKTGTGKKPKGSGRRLYTDEDPTDTVSVKFSSRQDIVDTLSKKSFKSKSHARQSQIINLIHQRVRAAYNRAKDPDVKRRLKTALDYAEKRKEASKKKTQRLKKEGMYPPYKANQVQQTRYKASDTFTRDIKKAEKLGYSEDMKEGDTYEKMAAKGKKAGNLKQGTVRKRLNIPKGEKIPLSLINKELARLKKMEKRSAKNQKYYKALTLAKTLKTTTNVKEQKLFSKEWWLDVITEEILNEGGAAGHMAHPFDLPNVNTGKDLLKSFEQAANSLKKQPGSVKIDGVNASIRLINLDGKRQFAMDRGSKKALDLRGVTKADLEDRFGAGHGMIKAGGDVLDIFNTALPSIEEELNALGLLNDPNVMFNMEYVSGKSNVQDYGKNFLAIHGLLDVVTKDVIGKSGKTLQKRITSEKRYDPVDMEELLKKLEPFAKKKGFEIYGSVPTTFTKDPDFKAELNKSYTIDFAEGSKTKSLASWLNDVTNIPKTDRLKMNIEETDSIKDVGALSKQVYFAVFGGENVDSLFSTEEEVQKAIQGATTYLATEKLGDAILDVLDSPMGSVNDHEGVVIRDPKISNRPFKVTGKFITGGVSSDFQKK